MQGGLVQVAGAVQGGHEPVARGQHLLGDQGIHAFGPDQGPIPDGGEEKEQTQEGQGQPGQPGGKAGAQAGHGGTGCSCGEGRAPQVRFHRSMVQMSARFPPIWRTTLGSNPECIMHWAQRGSWLAAVALPDRPLHQFAEGGVVGSRIW